MNDHYTILGVLPSAELIVIHAAYRALARKYHPDSGQTAANEANSRIRELYEAYEVLSNPEKRKAYDSERAKQTSEGFDFDTDAMRAAFRDADAEQESSWSLAVKYHPVLSIAYERLKKTSDKLAFAFRSTILATKRFDNCHDVASKMESEFIARYFGKQPKIVAFARQLIVDGNKAAARELNRVVSVLGASAPAETIISRITSEFSLPMGGAYGLTENHLAQAVVAYAYFDDAVHLIEMLGGRVTKKAKHGIVVLLDSHLMLPRTFENEGEVVKWVCDNVANKILKV